MHVSPALLAAGMGCAPLLPPGCQANGASCREGGRGIGLLGLVVVAADEEEEEEEEGMAALMLAEAGVGVCQQTPPTNPYRLSEPLWWWKLSLQNLGTCGCHGAWRGTGGTLQPGCVR